MAHDCDARMIATHALPRRTHEPPFGVAEWAPQSALVAAAGMPGACVAAERMRRRPLPNPLRPFDCLALPTSPIPPAARNPTKPSDTLPLALCPANIPPALDSPALADAYASPRITVFDSSLPPRLVGLPQPPSLSLTHAPTAAAATATPATATPATALDNDDDAGDLTPTLQAASAEGVAHSPGWWEQPQLRGGALAPLRLSGANFAAAGSTCEFAGVSVAAVVLSAPLASPGADGGDADDAGDANASALPLLGCQLRALDVPPTTLGRVDLVVRGPHPQPASQPIALILFDRHSAPHVAPLAAPASACLHGSGGAAVARTVNISACNVPAPTGDGRTGLRCGLFAVGGGAMAQGTLPLQVSLARLLTAPRASTASPCHPTGLVSCEWDAIDSPGTFHVRLSHDLGRRWSESASRFTLWSVQRLGPLAGPAVGGTVVTLSGVALPRCTNATGCVCAFGAARVAAHAVDDDDDDDDDDDGGGDEAVVEEAAAATVEEPGASGHRPAPAVVSRIVCVAPPAAAADPSTPPLTVDGAATRLEVSVSVAFDGAVSTGPHLTFAYYPPVALTALDFVYATLRIEPRSPPARPLECGLRWLRHVCARARSVSLGCAAYPCHWREGASSPSAVEASHRRLPTPPRPTATGAAALVRRLWRQQTRTHCGRTAHRSARRSHPRALWSPRRAPPMAACAASFPPPARRRAATRQRFGWTSGCALALRQRGRPKRRSPHRFIWAASRASLAASCASSSDRRASARVAPPASSHGRRTRR